MPNDNTSHISQNFTLGLQNLPQAVQSKLIENEKEKLRLGWLGRFLGANPQVHYVAIILLILILIVSICIYKKIDKLELSQLLDYIFPTIALLCGYIMGKIQS